MLAACGEHAGSMLAACGERAGSMQPAMLIDAPPSLPTSQPPDPPSGSWIHKKRKSYNASSRGRERAWAPARGPRLTLGKGVRVHLRGRPMDPRLLAEAQARLAMPEGELSAVLERQARLARGGEESLEASGGRASARGTTPGSRGGTS